MKSWSHQTEEELTTLLKEWLKQHGKTQADLAKGLESLSSRMPALLEILKKDYAKGGFHNVAARLCSIEKDWSGCQMKPRALETNNSERSSDPFGQLDLLLEEILEDCEGAET